MLELGQMDRRALLARAMLLVGASVAASACATLPALATAEPVAITPAQLATLTAYADTMIPRTNTPGALDVGVPASFVDLLQNWAAPATRASLLGVLDRIEHLPTDHRAFAMLPPVQRKSILQVFDAAALAPSGAPGGSPFGPPGAADPDYQRLKELILTLYYVSQPALTQELAYTHVPGRWQPSLPVTAATRPQGGPGMF